jgi:glycogen synthase
LPGVDNTKLDSNKQLVEVAWEVCNQLGGIYTVIRSKVPAAVKEWGTNYTLIGPYVHAGALAEFEPVEGSADPMALAVNKLRELGYGAVYGTWLITGRPKVVLLDFNTAMYKLNDVRYEFWSDHGYSVETADNLVNQTLAFGHLVKEFFFHLQEFRDADKTTLVHFHEWMAATALPGMRKLDLPYRTVFTTHATLLGRYLAMNSPDFYGTLPFADWQKEARHFNVEVIARLEREAGQNAHVMTTVSEVTGRECVQFIGRRADYILPNGLNIERFVALHEFQNLHQKYKSLIHEFVMGHFFSSYSFDLDKTLYFFTSGRFEYKNKGFDITLEALARLNHWLKYENVDINIVMFIVTKQPYTSINPFALQSRAIMEEVQATCKAIEKGIGEQLFYNAVKEKGINMPDLNQFVDDYWRLRLRRTLQGWKSEMLPLVVTHNLVNDGKDEVLNGIRHKNLINYPDDKVKVIYHPDFINATNPLFGMDYGQFVRGCHLGVFPSYYEPWGYTPLESIASGVPTITSNLAGFGDYVANTMPDHDANGIYITDRANQNYDMAADQLSQQMYNFVMQTRRDRINQRNRTESNSVSFGWDKLYRYYMMAYNSFENVSLN